MAQAKRTRGTTKRRLAATEPTGCGYSLKWSALTSLEGMTPIWIPNAQYEKVAASLAKKTKDKHARKLLRARAHPIGMTHTCGGTCAGGWCEEKEVPQDDDTAAVYVCECGYFV
jgi:hypothetical protein